MTAKNPFPRMKLVLGSVLLVALIAAGLAAVIPAPANAGANDRKLTQTFSMDDLNIYDLALTTSCGTEVDALVSFTQERRLELGNDRRPAAHETMTIDGQITWYAPATGKSYSDELHSRSRIEYPQGVADWPAPAHVTVTGSHAGTFPVGDGPPGHGKFEYEAQIYSVDSDGFPYTFVDSEPTWTGKGFDRATEKLCAALT